MTGPPKTGTTGVYASVKRGLARAGVDMRTVFEPTSADPLDSLFRYAPTTTVMTKVTMDKLDRVVPDVGVFDRRVMTVRDPRDALISALLFRPLTARSIGRAGESAVQHFIEALEAKEADAAAYSVLGLFELAQRLRIGRPPFEGMLTIARRQRELRERGMVHVLRYERFVAGDLDDVSAYLGFGVENVSARDATWIGHIARSQSSGDFVRWFREDDLGYFNDMFAEQLRAFGYDADVELDPEPKIDPATSSEYVRNRYADRRAQLDAGAHAEVDSPQALSRLVEAAEDGDPGACLRAAEVHRGGQLGGVDEMAALHWAQRAAELGSVRGMRTTVELLERLDPDAPELRRQLRVWRIELAQRARREQPAAAGQAPRAEGPAGTARPRWVKRVVRFGRHWFRRGP